MDESKWPSVAPVGIFWTWGNWDNLGWYDYLTTKTFDQLGDSNLYENWRDILVKKFFWFDREYLKGLSRSDRDKRFKIYFEMGEENPTASSVNDHK